MSHCVQILGDLKNGGVQAWVYWQVSAFYVIYMRSLTDKAHSLQFQMQWCLFS